MEEQLETINQKIGTIEDKMKLVGAINDMQETFTKRLNDLTNELEQIRNQTNRLEIDDKIPLHTVLKEIYKKDNRISDDKIVDLVVNMWSQKVDEYVEEIESEISKMSSTKLSSGSVNDWVAKKIVFNYQYGELTSMSAKYPKDIKVKEELGRAINDLETANSKINVTDELTVDGIRRHLLKEIHVLLKGYQTFLKSDNKSLEDLRKITLQHIYPGGQKLDILWSKEVTNIVSNRIEKLDNTIRSNSEKYKELTTEWKRLDKTMKESVTKLETIVKSIEKEIATLKDEISSINENVDTLKDRIDKLETVNETVESLKKKWIETEKNINTKINDMESNLSSIETGFADFKTQLETKTTKDVKKLNEEFEKRFGELEKWAEDNSDIVETYEEHVKSFSQEMIKVKQTHEVLAQKLTAMKTLETDLQNKIQEFKNYKEAQQKEYTDIKEKITEYLSKIMEAQQIPTKLREEMIAKYEQFESSMGKRNAAYTVMVTEQRKRMDRFGKKIEEFQNEIENIKTQNTESLKEQNIKIAKLYIKIDELEVRKSSVGSPTSKSSRLTPIKKLTPKEAHEKRIRLREMNLNKRGYGDYRDLILGTPLANLNPTKVSRDLYEEMNRLGQEIAKMQERREDVGATRQKYPPPSSQEDDMIKQRDEYGKLRQDLIDNEDVYSKLKNYEEIPKDKAQIINKLYGLDDTGIQALKFTTERKPRSKRVSRMRNYMPKQ